jgi:hypothetical protein
MRPKGHSKRGQRFETQQRKRSSARLPEHSVLSNGLVEGRGDRKLIHIFTFAQLGGKSKNRATTLPAAPRSPHTTHAYPSQKTPLVTSSSAAFHMPSQHALFPRRTAISIIVLSTFALVVALAPSRNQLKL